MTSSRREQPAEVPEEPGPGGLLRLRLNIAYDGTDFHGWARQPGLRTVQAELEHALRAVLHVDASQPVRVAVAGRTDAGVHAIGQVCHCDIPQDAWTEIGLQRPSRRDLADPGSRTAEAVVTRRLNGLLGADLRVHRVRVAPLGFDARWSAAWRQYVYLVADDPADLDPRTRGHVLASHPLDVEAMAVAAQPFAGEHDFTAFCRARAGASSVRTIQRIGWGRRTPVGDGPGVAEFRIRSDAFCHSMVRSLVGSFLAVGEGRWPAGRPAELLAEAVRVSSVPTAPAHGLTLEAVGYPTEADLADQARRARRWRGRQSV